MGKKESEAFAQSKGFMSCGESEIEIEVQLTDDDKIKFGKAQSDSLAEITLIEEGLSEYKSECKSKIESQQGVINKTSLALRTGKQRITRRLPSFIDRKGMKVWIDLETGEIMFSRPATDQERQGALA